MKEEEEKMKEEKKLSIIKNVKGIVKFPNLEDGKFSLKLLFDRKVEKMLNEIQDEIGEDIAISYVTHDGIEYPAFNVKTSYDIPVYDTLGNIINVDKDYPIYDGAKVILKLNFKFYEYKEKGKRFTKTGITAYLMGAVIIEQGTPYQNETKFDDFKEELEDEEPQF